MATYLQNGSAMGLFDAHGGGPFKLNTLLYQTATEFGLKNTDGSVTYVRGTGFSWNFAEGKFTGGTVTSIAHFTPGGSFIDSLTGLSLSAYTVQTAFEAAALSRDAFRQVFLSGNDTIDMRYKAGGAAAFTGYAGDDTMLGTPGADTFYGGSGKDRLNGFDGNDFLNGGVDDDIVYAGAGSDRIVGDGGGDALIGGDGDDFIYAGAGNDSQNGEAGTDTAVYQRLLSELIITITPTSFSVIEPNGQDWLYSIERLATDDGVFVRDFGAGTWVKISSQPGISFIYPEQYMMLTGGNDTVNLQGTGKTIVSAYNGDDRIQGAAGWDTLLGGGGNDTLYGDIYGQTVSNDRLIGEAGVDILYGYAGDDLLYGGDGYDYISGGDGADRLWGDKGNDHLIGGKGADIFVFTDDINGADTIADWEHGTDKLHVDASAFGGGLYPGGLAANRLVASSAPWAGLAIGQFLYNTSTGALGWDADGTGSGAATAIAVLKLAGGGVPVLTASDFWITV